MAIQLIRQLLLWMPLLFGFGFIAPLTAQLMMASGISAPFGLPPIVVGLAFGGAWGLYAQIKGRWL